jgi:hypothetical protein
MVQDFSSLPPEQEREFVVFEEKTRESAQSAMRIGIASGAIFGALVIIIVMSYDKPPPKIKAEDIAVETQSARPVRARPAAAPALAPATEPSAGTETGAGTGMGEPGAGAGETAAPTAGVAASPTGGVGVTPAAPGTTAATPTAPKPPPGATKAPPTALVPK